MKTASITEAKNKLSGLIRGLGSGPVLILDRGRPVARLAAVTGLGTEESRRHWTELARKGLIALPEQAPDPKLYQRPPLKLKPGYSAVAALLAERREGR